MNEEEKAVREYLIKILTDFHNCRLKGLGYDFFFVLSNDLDDLNKKIK